MRLPHPDTFSPNQWESRFIMKNWLLSVILILGGFGANGMAVEAGSFGLGWNYGILSVQNQQTGLYSFGSKIPLSSSFEIAAGFSFGSVKFDSLSSNQTFRLSGFEFALGKYFGLRSRINPFLQFSGHGFWIDDRNDGLGWFTTVGPGTGLRLRLSDRLAFNVAGAYHFWLTGARPDFLEKQMSVPFLKIQLGLHYHFPIQHATIADIIDSDDSYSLALSEKEQVDFAVQLVNYERKESELTTLKNLKSEELTPEIERQIQALKMALVDKNLSLTQLLKLNSDSEKRIAELEHRVLGESKEPLAQIDTRIASVEPVRTDRSLSKIDRLDLQPVPAPTADTTRSMPESETDLLTDLKAYYQLYQNAHQYFNNRSYAQAIQLFQQLMANHPSHNLVSNCQYWIGESYYGMQNYRAAIEALLKTLEYKNSSKIDDALLMLGQAYFRLGEKNEASVYFKKLIDEFPKSEYRSIAQAYIHRFKS